MGFWGTLAYLRSPRPAESLDALSSWAALGMDCRQQGGDWQGVQFRHDQDLDWRAVLTEVMHETARPVLGAFVLDDDPDYLREREHLRAALTEMCGPVEETARRAVRWSAAAGYDVDTEPVLRALSATGGFVEEVFEALARALGIRARR